MTATTPNPAVLESRYAWLRLLAAVMLMTIGGAGMYTVVVVLPALQNEFQIARAAASFPFTATMLGFAAGGLVMGKLVDRYGVMVPVLLGAVFLSGVFYTFFVSAQPRQNPSAHTLHRKRTP